MSFKPFFVLVPIVTSVKEIGYVANKLHTYHLTNYLIKLCQHPRIYVFFFILYFYSSLEDFSFVISHSLSNYE